MKVGTLCYATDQGLGLLAKAFYDNGVVTDPLVVYHTSRHTHREWYPNAQTTHANKVDMGVAQRLIRSVDIMLFFETPFVWDLIAYCKRIGKPSIIMPMYECMPKELPFYPDLMLCPSMLDYQYYRGQNSTFLQVPVDVPWMQRNVAQRFVHNAGHGGLRGRNGTRELIEAMQHTRSDVRLTIRSQSPLIIPPHCRHLLDNRIKFEYGTIPHTDLYTYHDVFVFPEKFNGLSLPLQEAHASGLVVMCTNRYPMNEWLPTEPMIPSRGSRLAEVSGRCNVFNEEIVDPEDIAATLDAWYGRDITALSLSGKAYAQANSWEVLKPKYMEVLESLV